MKILPKNNMIFVQHHLQQVEEKSAGGIMLPKSAQKQQQTNDGVITHVAWVENEPEYKVGQHVIFGEYAGAPIEIDGRQYLAMKECDIIAVIEEDEPSHSVEEVAEVIDKTNKLLES